MEIRHIQLPKITVRKEEYELDSQDIPQEPKGAIKYSLNIAEFPIFSNNKNLKDNEAVEYIFSTEDQQFMQITPSNNPQNINNKILQEFDEKIFYGLLSLYSETGSKNIIIDHPDLLKKSGINYNGRNLNRVKDSLERMNGCEIFFNKIYYDPVAKKEGGDYLRKTKRFYLINNLETISIEKFNEMGDKSKKKYKEHFEKHKNIKEIASFNLSDSIVNEIDLKAFKYFDHKNLLSIKDYTARQLYILLMKWRHWQKTFTIKRRAKFLASRIPLSWKPQNRTKTLRSIKKACEYLKKIKFLNDYVFKNKGKDTTIEFFINKEKLEKYNKKVGIETTGQEDLEIKLIKHIPNIDLLLKLIPKRYHKDLKPIFTEQLNAKSFEQIKSYIEHALKNSSGNFVGFLKKSLEQNWNIISQEADPLINKAKKCYSNCKGSCGATWTEYKERKNHECHYCVKFKK